MHRRRLPGRVEQITAGTARTFQMRRAGRKAFRIGLDCGGDAGGVSRPLSAIEDRAPARGLSARAQCAGPLRRRAHQERDDGVPRPPRRPRHRIRIGEGRPGPAPARSSSSICSLVSELTRSISCAGWSTSRPPRRSNARATTAFTPHSSSDCRITSSPIPSCSRPEAPTGCNHRTPCSAADAETIGSSSTTPNRWVTS